MMVLLRALLRPALALGLIAALPAHADEGAARAALSAPGTLVLMMRHARAPGGGDPAGFRLEDCATQRNLDGAGRAQAAAIGAALAADGFAPDRVLTSRLCRCRDTAELLGLGAAEGFAPLDSFFADRGRAPAQTAALRAMLAGMADGEKIVLVTHQVNITALTGIYPASGEAAVFRPGPDGAPQMIGTILIRP